MKPLQRLALATLTGATLLTAFAPAPTHHLEKARALLTVGPVSTAADTDPPADPLEAAPRPDLWRRVGLRLNRNRILKAIRREYRRQLLASAPPPPRKKRRMTGKRPVVSALADPRRRR